MEEQTCYDILCNTISRLRKEADITQEQLADQLGISPQAVSKWESKRSCPDIGLLPQIARIFDTTIDQLFGIAPKAVESPDPPPIGIVKHLPWPDNEDFHVVLYQGHRLRRFFIGSERQNMRFHYDGPAQNVSCAVNLACEKDVLGHVSAGKDVMILGDVKGGPVEAGKNVVVHGSVTGNVSAGKDCQVGQNVDGRISAGKNTAIRGNAKGGIKAGGQVKIEWTEQKREGEDPQEDSLENT